MRSIYNKKCKVGDIVLAITKNGVQQIIIDKVENSQVGYGDEVINEIYYYGRPINGAGTLKIPKNNVIIKMPKI